MAYDRLFHREMLARSVPNPRLYSEAFTGRANYSARTTQGEAAPTIRIPHSPIPGHSVAPERTLISVTATQCPPTEARRSAGSLPELQCRFTRCRYMHICSDWSRPHAAIHCPQHRATPVNRGHPEPELKKLTQDIIELHHLNQAVVSISRSENRKRAHPLYDQPQS